MELNIEDLKKHINKLEADVWNLSKLITKIVDDKKDVNEDSFNDEHDKTEQKKKNEQHKELKKEQREKNEQLRICRNMYANLNRDNRGQGKAEDALEEVMKAIQNYKQNTPAIQQKQI